MNGMLRDTGEKVEIFYEQGIEHDNLTITTPDGETFIGKAVMVDRSSSIGWVTTPEGNAAFGTVETYSGNVRAVLFGDNKNTMRCSLQYADSGGFTSEGGVGVCEISDGRVFDVIW